MIKIEDKDKDYVYIYSENPSEIDYLVSKTKTAIMTMYKGCQAIIVKKEKAKIE